MFYLPTFGGVEQVIYELAQRQINEGHEVHVFCCDSDKNKRIKPLDETLEGVRVHRVPYLLRLSLNTHIWPGLFSRFKEINEKFPEDKGKILVIEPESGDYFIDEN